MIGAEGVELFVPAGYDVMWSVAILAPLVLLGIALTVWFRDRHHLERGLFGGGVLDVLVILLVPVLGPAAYLIGRSWARRRRDVAGAALEV